MRFGCSTMSLFGSSSSVLLMLLLGGLSVSLSWTFCFALRLLPYMVSLACRIVFRAGVVVRTGILVCVGVVVRAGVIAVLPLSQ